MPARPDQPTASLVRPAAAPVEPSALAPAEPSESSVLAPAEPSEPSVLAPVESRKPLLAPIEPSEAVEPTQIPTARPARENEKRPPFQLRPRSSQPSPPRPPSHFRHLAGAQVTHASGLFGLREQQVDSLGLTWVTARLKRGGDPSGLAAIRLGEQLDVVSKVGDERSSVRVLALGRSGYFAPGRKITSMALGLDAREWARARAGNPDTEARLGARGALAVFKPIDAAMPK